jgi:hypothetical protein
MRFPARRSGHSDGWSDLRKRRFPVPRRAVPRESQVTAHRRARTVGHGVGHDRGRNGSPVGATPQVLQPSRLKRPGRRQAGGRRQGHRRMPRPSVAERREVRSLLKERRSGWAEEGKMIPGAPGFPQQDGQSTDKLHAPGRSSRLTWERTLNDGADALASAALIGEWSWAVRFFTGAATSSRALSSIALPMMQFCPVELAAFLELSQSTVCPPRSYKIAGNLQWFTSIRDQGRRFGQTPRVLGIVGEKLSSHPGTALSEAATNVLLYSSTIFSKVGSPRRTHGEDLASESRSSPSFVRRSRCRMSVETSPGW